MRTKSANIALALAAAVVTMGLAAPAQAQRRDRDRDQRTSRGRSSFNYFHNRSQMERDFQRDRGSSRIRVHGSFPRTTRRYGDHWRYGYRRDRRFDDHHFRFGFYLFSPFAADSYPSPWYYYPSLPPYVPSDRVIVVPDYGYSWDVGAPYHRGDSALDQAVDDIQDAFGQGNADAADALIPADSRVAIFQDGRYEYSLKGDDFEEMISDNVQNTDSESFHIDSVRRSGDNAVVRATQVLRDEDDATDTVHQRIHLRRVGDQWEITDFMTSR
ncbi:MAG TPA: nuclear transport factor 2 family protein [Fimbriimonas sp.]|nr:nuclear transport factor 2 family protein [Fimbriimonas sp.]